MKKYEVSEEFIKAGHAEACGEWKRRIEREFPEVFKPYAKIGDVYMGPHNDKYLLAQTGTRMVAFICLEDGNRYADAVAVADPTRISPEELIRIADNHHGSFIKSKI